MTARRERWVSARPLSGLTSTAHATRTVAHSTDSAVFGGAEQALLNVLEYQDRQSWNPVLLGHRASGLTPLLTAARELGVPVYELSRLSDTDAVGRVREVARLLRGIRPAVFHAHLTWPAACRGGLVGAALVRVPAIVATEQLFMELGRAGRAVQRVLDVIVHRYIAVSEHGKHALCTHFKVAPRKVCVVRNGVDVQPLPRDDGTLRKSLSGLGDRPLVLTAARLHEQRAIDS